MISVLAVSMPAAPRMVVDAAPKFPQVFASIDSSLQNLKPLQFASDVSIPSVDATPALAFFHNATAFVGNVKSVVIPSVPAGLEGAKLPTFGERTVAFFTPLLGFFKSSSTTATTAAAPASPSQPTSVVDFDFDNDGKADIGRWRVASTDFIVRNSNSGSTSDPFVLPTTSKITPGDFNGDGKTDAGVFTIVSGVGTWTYKTSPSATAQTISFGTTGDIPVAGDYDGDGTTDAAIYRPSTNTWWIKKSSNGTTTSTAFGSANDITVPGDYDGDGKNDLALFRPNTGDWHITGSTAGYFTLHWGLSSDTPVPADFDGDGKTDPAVFRPSTGTWYVYRSDLNNGSFYQQAWGNYRDQPVPADYDGDGKADYAIWRPTTGVWYIRKSSDSNFEMYTLGAPGDTAVPSAYLKQVGGEVTGDALNAARLSPKNATGGTDLYSQNFGWGTSLVNLPGRAGLNANLGISYNSLVWTKVGNAMVFDADNSNASPGFRLGLPTIEPIYYDTDNGKNTWSYMMVTPSGGRVQFRQTVVTNVYETADSNYTQLVVNGASNPNDRVENLWLMVRTTDGTQMIYSWNLGAYRCTQIRDRNGNYISIAYNGEGQLTSITDTLGRVITVSYDSSTGLPSSINFSRYTGNGSGSLVTQPWVSFTYTDLTVNATFDSSLTIVGPPNGTVIKVLDRITYADGSTTRFSYNGFAQVSKVETYAPNGGFLNHVELSYIQSPSSEVAVSTLELPRLRQTQTKVRDFNGDNPVMVNNEVRSGNVTDMDGATVSAKLVQVWMVNHPTGNIINTYVGASGWMEGLPIRVDDWANGTGGLEIKRSSFTKWTQDDISSSIHYPINPRVIESRVSDGANTKKTAIDYYPVDSSTPHSGLVKAVKIGDTSTVYKKVETTYQLDPAYVSRRIIGLPSEVKVWGQNDEYVSNVTYTYDGEDFSVEPNQNVAIAVGHDSNYGGSFVTGRGNLTKTARHSVTNSADVSESEVRYDIAGSPVARIDPRGRKTAISYADNFNTTVSNATFAYPTKLTDAGGFYSTIQYRFDLGANIWAQSPTPEGATQGKTTSRIYDEISGRVTKEKIESTGAYTRYEYPSTGLLAKSYTTINDIVGVGTVDASDEVLSESILDGAGRLLRTRNENPTGGYIGKKVQYDILGRGIAESVPTEINSSWTPTGDDYRGLDSSSNPIWLWNQKEYDWKGRVTREINTDGTDRKYSYAGCGCAGGQETTIQGELTEAYDVNDVKQNNKRRTQKIYEDVMGRVIKTEIRDLDSVTGAPYSTTVNTYNGRDQITQVDEYVGASGTHQTTTFEFDGHGRLKKSHKPEWFDSNNDPTYTEYTYNPDDTIGSVTDPRGAAMYYEYGNSSNATGERRALLTNVNFTSPDTTTIPLPGNVAFVYDNAGNRKSMSDGSGTLTYTFDELSRLASETKSFAGTGAPSGSYTLQYTYTLAGGIKSIKDPSSTSGWEVKYTGDKIGRTTQVGNAGAADAFAKNIVYRAFGGVKSMQYSTTDTTNISLTYDERLRPITYEAESSANTTDIQNKTYSYSNDGSIKQATNNLDSAYSQTYEYDFASRLKKNEMGGTSGPYKQTLGYDEFDHLTSRSTTTDGTTRSFTAGFTNNRKSWGGYGSSPLDVFDSAGNVTYNIASGSPIDKRFWKFDAAGHVTDWLETSLYAGNTLHEQGELLTFDGDGRTVKRLKKSRVYANPPEPFSERPEYYIYSSVTGKILVELDGIGNASKRNVYFNGSVIAEETPGFGFVFKHNDPIAGSEMQTESSGEITLNDVGRVERAAMGEIIQTTEPELITPPHNYSKGASTDNPEKCMENGFPTECGQLRDSLRAQGLLSGDWLILHTVGDIPGVEPGYPSRTVDLGTTVVDLGPEGEHALGDFRERFNTAVTKVEEILNGDNDCAKFFQRKDIALKALTAFAQKAEIGIVESASDDVHGIRQESPDDAPTQAYNSDGSLYEGGKPAAAYRVFGKITVNQNGPFFKKFSNAPRLGGYPHGELKSQVLQILHELAHSVLDEDGHPLIEDDKNKKAINEKNTEKIKKACKTEIEAVGGRK